MTKRQRRIVYPAVFGLAGFAVTFGFFIGAIDAMFGFDSGLYLTVITLGLLATFAGIQLATPRRSRDLNSRRAA